MICLPNNATLTFDHSGVVLVVVWGCVSINAHENNRFQFIKFPLVYYVFLLFQPTPFIYLLTYSGISLFNKYLLNIYSLPGDAGYTG